MTLTERRAKLLSLIIGEYVDSAMPVGSDALVRRFELPFSSATIRNEMARLEEEGYISHPHTSAGRVPSDKGYRYYVEALMEERDLSAQIKQTIRHQFHQAGRDEDEWVHLAAAVLARAVENAAVVTMPNMAESRLKRMELVSIQDTSALLVVVMQQARVKQQVLIFPEPMEQDDADVDQQPPERRLPGPQRGRDRAGTAQSCGSRNCTSTHRRRHTKSRPLVRPFRHRRSGTGERGRRSV